MLPYRSIFVTGATGFVGRYLLDAIRTRLSSDAVVHCATACDGQPVDLLDVDALRAAIAKAQPDLVFHLAAQSSVGQSGAMAAATWRVNLCGTLNLCEVIAAEAPSAVIAFTSSSEVYGASFKTGVVTEDAAPAPLSVYAQTKRAAEDVLRETLRPTNRLIIFRPTNHSGPGQDSRFVVPAFAEQIAAIESGRRPAVMQVGSLTAERDFLDVRDVVDAYLDAVSAPGLAQCETFNIASGRLVSIGELLDMLLKLTDTKVTIEQDSARLRPSEIPRAAVNAERIRVKTSWSPSYTLEQTLADILNHFRSQYRSAAEPRT